ncbi:16S rRNA (uracil(1498)-N(3))-methyltransferase [Anditalea andensis]|uniref:Ribosomal RNA small subunit methyltransferase E n=1 Tax=Anditalea andensis TaxID=1048983 RepID=A0A074KW31_9BACT|nr:16S rRNA (uracil(1498)-N(3))-methyltransferase [Anditalea andensis]KEO74171.1 hypothetical protein EL17_08510 [Anditalea andensis]
MHLFYHSPILDKSFLLEKEENHHLIKVLRKSAGDEILFTDGEGYLYECRIEELTMKKTIISVLDKKLQIKNPFHIHLAIAPTKNADRMEWMVEKAVEIGVDRITLIKTAHSERNYLKSERLEKKAISALKQSLKYYKTIIDQENNFESLVSAPNIANTEKFIAYVDENLPHHLIEMANKKSNYLILIGPEGDFSAEEITLALSNGFKPCSLGPSRLRTETAGIVAVHSLNLINI